MITVPYGALIVTGCGCGCVKFFSLLPCLVSLHCPGAKRKHDSTPGPLKAHYCTSITAAKRAAQKPKHERGLLQEFKTVLAELNTKALKHKA